MSTTADLRAEYDDAALSSAASSPPGSPRLSPAPQPMLSKRKRIASEYNGSDSESDNQDSDNNQDAASIDNNLEDNHNSVAVNRNLTAYAKQLALKKRLRRDYIDDLISFSQVCLRLYIFLVELTVCRIRVRFETSRYMVFFCESHKPKIIRLLRRLHGHRREALRYALVNL